MADYHLHLHEHAWTERVEADFSLARIEQFVDTAAAKGVHELCFTEHYYRCAESAETLGLFWEHETPDVVAMTAEMIALDRSLTLEAYVEGVVAAKDAGLPVKLGLELDFLPDSIDRVLDQIAGYPFDFIVGSVHWIGGLTIDMQGAMGVIEQRGLRATWEEYARLIEALGRGGYVDAVGHIDVLKKYGLRLPEEPVDLYGAMVDALADGGVALEVNTAGLRRPAAELYPSQTLLRLAHERGIPITFGSDGHAPSDAGADLDCAVAAARAAGYDTRLRFEARTRVEVPL